MTIGSNGLKLIKHFEGCRLNSYQDQGGVWTIGYGHTTSVSPNQTITEDQALAFLTHDLDIHCEYVNHLVFYPLNQNMFDSVVSFCYNEGPLHLKNSTLLKYLNQGSVLIAAAQFDKWVYVDKHIDPGLVKRRAAEKSLFLLPMDEEFELK